MSKQIHLLVIDPQIDFCDPTGSLYVKGADGDMDRLSAMVDRLGAKIDDIHVTLDSHQVLHIAHPIFWRDKNGNKPSPFTIITNQDVLNGTWVPFSPALRDWSLFYTSELEKNGRYALCVWPPHCIIGTKGHSIYPCFSDSINRWAYENNALIQVVTKGSNWKTEHYSAVMADVPDPSDPTTQLAKGVIDAMGVADVIAVAGEALDFCVANTLRDIIKEFGKENAKKFVILTDATSAVNAPGCEHLAQEFLDEMSTLGVQTSTTVDFLA